MPSPGGSRPDASCQASTSCTPRCHARRASSCSSVSIALLHDRCQRRPLRIIVPTPRTQQDGHGVRPAYPNIDPARPYAPTDRATAEPSAERVIERHQPILGTHTGPYGATSTIPCTAWQRRQLTVRLPSLYITSNALPCRHAGVSSRRVVRATCTTG